MVALVVDLIVVTTVSLSVATLPVLALQQVTGQVPGWFEVGMAVAAGLLPWLYFTISWWVTGQTAGGLLVGMMVQRPDGGHVHLVQAALRAAIGLVLWPVWLVGMLAILWEPRRRAWHDKLCHTVVRHVR